MGCGLHAPIFSGRVPLVRAGTSRDLQERGWRVLYLVVPRLTSAFQSRPFSPFKVLPPVCRAFRVSWRCLRRKMIISFIQTAYVAEDLAVLKFPVLDRDVERSSKAVRGEHSPSPERRAKERTVWLRMKRGRQHSAQEPFRGMPETVCRVPESQSGRSTFRLRLRKLNWDGIRKTSNM